MVTSRGTLLALEQLGWISEPPEHVRPKDKPWGNADGYHYVDDAVADPLPTLSWRRGTGRNTTKSWVSQALEFQLRYVDGCFYPFVFFRDYVEPEHKVDAALPEPSLEWFDHFPTEPGTYWLYGDPEFGSMGGHYTGTIPFEPAMYFVEIFEIANGMLAKTEGRMVFDRPFDAEKRQAGFIGKWRKATLPDPPKLDYPIIPKS